MDWKNIEKNESQIVKGGVEKTLSLKSLKS